MYFNLDDQRNKNKKNLIKKILDKLDYLHSKTSMSLSLLIIIFVFLVATFWYSAESHAYLIKHFYCK